MNLFIFPDAVNRNGKGETIKLNVEDGSFYFNHGEDFVCVDTTLLRDGSSTMVVLNTLTDKLYVLYNFRELLEVLDMTPSEMLSTLAQKGFMQIDKSGGKLYVKVFLLAGDYELESDTTDFSKYKHCTADFIHPWIFVRSPTSYPLRFSLEKYGISQIPEPHPHGTECFYYNSSQSALLPRSAARNQPHYSHT